LTVVLTNCVLRKNDCILSFENCYQAVTNVTG